MTHTAMSFLRATAVFLLLTVLFLCSCGSGGQNDPSDPTDVTTDVGDTTAPADETTLVADVPPLELPETLDYGGYTVRVLSNESNAEQRKEGQKDNGTLFRDELRNEVINDAIYNRQIWVEDRLGVELVNVPCTTGTVREYVERMVQSGDSDVDFAAAPCAATMWSSQFGYYLDLTEYENLDMSQPWWSQDFIKESSFGGRVYFLTGDLSLDLLRRTFVMYYNKPLAEDHGITGVYDLVFDGKWTIDKLTELASNIYIDVNGNSERDEEDIYGYLTDSLNADPLWSAFDIDILSKDEDDYLLYTPQLEKYGIAFEKTWALFYAPTTYFESLFHVESPETMFASGNGLFAGATLGCVESMEFRNMQSEYGVLPIPKFDENQKEYYTMPHDQYMVFGIPMTATDPDLSAAVMEAMGWYSASYVRPAYLDVGLKGQYANDPETRKIMDMIVNGIRIDAAWIYAYYLDDYPQMWRYSLSEGDEQYASKVAKKERNLKILLNSLNEVYQALP